MPANDSALPDFLPNCLPILIGSLPLADHHEATELIFRYTPEIPLWPQLPKNQREGMVRQFLSGFPGLIDRGSSSWVDAEAAGFTAAMTGFYEHFLACEELPTLPENSLFALNEDTARGFFTFTRRLKAVHPSPMTVKGQVTGPVTAGIGIRDQHGRPLLYDENLRDMLNKLLAGKARWQAEQLRQFCGEIPPIIFIDEPGIVSFGSTALAGVSKQLVAAEVSELIGAIKRAGGLSGIHICANGDWEPALSSGADIISFDSYSYFDNLILYRAHLIDFLKRGGILAWGIVPTAEPDIVAAEQVETLYDKWREQLENLCSFGFASREIVAKTLIAPACGTGSLSFELALKVLEMTRGLADRIRSEYAL